MTKQVSSTASEQTDLQPKPLSVLIKKITDKKGVDIMLHVRFGRIVFLVVALVSVGQFANTIYVPALSLIANNLKINPENTQFLMTAYLLPYGLTQFIYGPLSDIYGRRPLVLCGLAIFLIGSVLTVLANDFAVLLSGCLIQGLGAGVAGVMARTVMRDCYTDHKLYQANSIVSLCLIFAPLIAPVIGGLLSVCCGWRSDFIFLFVLSGSVLCLEYSLFPETHIKRSTDQQINWSSIKAKYTQALKLKKFNGYMLCMSLSFAGIAVFEASASILMTNILHYSPEAVSFLFIIPIPGFLIGSYLASYINKFISLDQILKLSILLILLGVTSLAVPAFAHVLNIEVILIPITIYMLGTGLLFPTAMTGALNPLGKIAGTAGALLGGVQNLCAAGMTVLFTLIPQTTQRPLALVLSLCCLLIVLTYWIFLQSDNIID